MQCYFANYYRYFEGNCSLHFQAISSCTKEPSFFRQTKTFIFDQKNAFVLYFL